MVKYLQIQKNGVFDMILIINKTHEGRLYYREKFYNTGMDAYACSFRSVSALLGRYKFDAVILTDASEYGRVHLLCRDFKAEFPSVPLIVLAKGEDGATLDKMIKFVDNIILPNTPFSKIMEIIFEYIRAFFRKDVTDMIAASVRIVYYKKAVYVGGFLFNATKTEYAILRYLVASHPEGAESGDILRFCFRPSSSVSESNVTSFVHSINKKSEKMFGRRLIAMNNKRYQISF